MRNVTKTLQMLFVVILTTFAFATQSMAQTLMSESFENGGSVPAGWATEVVSGTNTVTFVTSSSWPSGYNAYNGAYLVRFNSFSANNGVVRLKKTTPISTVAYSNVSVDFAWLESSGYAANLDRVDVEWSTDGTTWNTAGTFNRYNAVQGWKIKSQLLPVGAQGQANLYVAFKFTSTYGNDCYLDLARVFAPVAPGVAVLGAPANAATGVLTTSTLNWTAPVSGDPATGYKLFFGTDNPPTNLVNGIDLGNVLSYDPSPDMIFNTPYFWKVVPYNIAGDATGAPVWSFTTLAGFGTLQGYVLNCYGVPVQGANVAAQGPATYTTVTGVDGKYQFFNIPASTYTIGAQLAGYNTTTLTGIVVGASLTTDQNITLPQPGMTVLPNPNNVSLSPNEYQNNAFTVTNPACGQLTWTATIAYGSANHSWFTMPTLTGVVAPSTNASVPALFNATGLPVGTLLTANVTFTSNPNVGTLVVPVTMTVAGTPLVPVTNLEGTLTNQMTGAVTLTWECAPSAGFLYYQVKRNGTQIAIVPAATTYNEILPAYGVYTYEVSAWYTDGQTAPASVVVEWPNPTMTLTPAALAATVWSGSYANVPLSINNTGLGTLAFEFPDYLDNSGDSPLAYCAGSGGCDEFISKVVFNTINNSSTCSNYANYTAITTDLEKGMSYAMTVTVGPPSYGTDITGVWIDYDHNNTFDAGEFTALSGAASATGNILVPTSAMTGPTTMRVRLQYGGTLAPCGTTSYGEVEDYTVNIKAPSFITVVAPASGFVAADDHQLVNVKFEATGDYTAAGVYVNQLALQSNDLANASVSIPCTMTVTVPGTISGIVTDGMSGDVLPGVQVTAGTFSAMTDDNGAYTMLADAGAYVMTFTKIGYQQLTGINTTVTANTVTTVNAQMFEAPYAPSCASASVNADDTQSTVTWCLPAGPYELLYDDGTAENFAAWQLPGNMNAVKFTPKGYPAKVVGAKVFVGDGTFPVGGVVLGAPFTVAVYNAASNGMPGTQIDTVAVTVTNLGWINVTGLDATITSGDFFIVMKQGSMSPNCAPIGVDETAPKAYKSYSRNVGTNSPWVLSPYQDFMMHAVVNSPMADDDAMAVSTTVVPGKVAGMISQSKPMATAGQTGMIASVTAPEGYDNMDMVSKYSLTRIFLGAVTPVLPAAGVPTLISNSITALTYTEGGTTWAALPQGWYAYCVKAVYPNGDESDCAYTNNVPHKMFADLTINVKLVCGFVPAVGAVVTLTGSDYPNDVVTATVPASGTVFFDNMIKGKYDLVISFGGYYNYSMVVNLTGNKTIDAVLEDIRYMPRNLTVDCGTLIATWEEPMAFAIQENFEGGVFPPAGWQATTQGSVGWYATTDGSSAYFSIPAHTTYAVANDDEGGSSNNGCCDYLTTPELDLTGAPSYVLNFQSYYTGEYGQMAYVEMSTDNGGSWTPIFTCTPVASWNQVSVDLSAYSGNAGLASVKFAFHSDDAGQYASGWAIDDVVLASGGVPVQGYGVFLDATEVGQTQDLTWTFDPNTVNYGQTYVAGVAGLYCSGYSDLETYTFTSCFLYPPRNLQATANVSTTSGAAILTWEAPLTGDRPTGGMTYQQWVSANNLVFANNNAPTSNGQALSVNQTVLPAPTTVDFSAAANSKAFGALSGDSFINWQLDAPGTFTTFGTSTPSGFIMEAEIINGLYYGVNDAGSWFSMDTTTGVVTTIGNTGNVNLSALAYDKSTSTLYGIDFNGGFFTVDPATGILTSIGSTSTYVIAATCDAAGIIYGVDIQNDVFGSIDKTTGAWATIADLPFDANYGQDMATDFGTNTIYYGAYNNSAGAGQEYIVDATTGVMTLVGNFEGNAQVMGFAIPTAAGGGGVSGNLVSYNLYRDDAVVANIPVPELTYWDLNLAPATYCYDITAVYDLTPYGFPGTTGESVKEGTACVDIAYGFALPFLEDWTTGQFDVNLWTVGQNWIMDGQAGNILPSAKFKWDPLLTDYSSSLESFFMNATTVNTTTPYKIWLDYDLKLDDRTASTNELLTVEVWNGSSWSKVKEYANNGDFDWTAEHVNISAGAKGNVFKVRFRANGALTGDIFSWAVDNIHIYVGYEFMPPLNLVATSEGTPKNDIKLTWSAPEGGGTVMSYILDDNTSEDYVYFTAAGEGWLGNEFAVTDAGVLQSASINMASNGGSAVYSFDIFDASQNLVGSSATFVPTFDEWTNVALPDIPFNGTFYVMLHMAVATQSDGLYLDYDGPNAAGNYEWYYDGSAFAKLTDFGFTPCVTFVRASGLVGDKKTQVTFQPGTAGTNYVSPLAGTLAHKAVSVNTGTEVAHATPLTDNSEALTGYNVYRRAYAVFPAGQNTAAAGDWTKIATVVPTEYLDMNLSNLVTNCYEYNVTAVYDEGESLPSNIDWECIFVGVNPNEANEVKVYPNPATTYVRIDLTKEVTQISVFNSLGSVVADKNVKGETTITLNTANYAAGAYSVKFTTASGDTFSRKFVVTK